MTVRHALSLATERLDDLNSARLDSEILLGYILRVSRAKLLAMFDEELTTEQRVELEKMTARRAQHEPIGYIIGHKEFYGLDFIVDERVLIPRPETENLVEYVVEHAKRNITLLDVGTGSGAIACAIKHVRPDIAVYASDVSPEALKVAKNNAAQHELEITFFESDLLEEAAPSYDCIVANLPYVASTEDLNQDATHEPELALLSKNDGLAHYQSLFNQLNNPRFQTVKQVIIEANPEQFPQLQQKTWDFSQVSDYIGVFSR